MNTLARLKSGLNHSIRNVRGILFPSRSDHHLAAGKFQLRSTARPWDTHRLSRPKGALTTTRSTSGSSTSLNYADRHVAVPNTQYSCTVKSAKPASNACVEICWSDGTLDTFPAVFLRDACQCSECFNPHSKSRILLLKDLDVNVEAASVKIIGRHEEKVEISWTDGHQSIFEASWLKRRSFNPATVSEKNGYYSERKHMWSSEMQDKIPRFSFTEIMEDDGALLNWLLTLDRYGLTLMFDIPCNEKELAKISDRVGPIKRTHYGYFFPVKHEVEPNNLSATGATLGLHMDLPFCEYSPQVQFLQCIEQSHCSGGENEFADAYYVASQLKEHYPDEYNILTSTPVDYYDVGVDRGHEFHMAFRRPIIGTNWRGDVTDIYFNQQVRAYMLTLPAETVKPLYKAMKHFNELLYENTITYKLKPGECAIFDNTRLKHGRLGYEITGNGGRHLEGIYMDWDHVRSRVRLLKDKMGLNVL